MMEAMTTDLATVISLAKAHARDILVPNLPHTVYSLRQFIKTNEAQVLKDPEIVELVTRQKGHLAECEAALQLFCKRLEGFRSSRRCPVCHHTANTVGPFFDAHNAGHFFRDGELVPSPICSGSGQRMRAGRYPLPQGHCTLPL